MNLLYAFCQTNNTQRFDNMLLLIKLKGHRKKYKFILYLFYTIFIIHLITLNRWMSYYTCKVGFSWMVSTYLKALFRWSHLTELSAVTTMEKWKLSLLTRKTDGTCNGYIICNCLQNLQKTKTIINAKFRGLYSSKWFLVWVIIPITCWPTWASKQIEWDSPFRFNRICLFLWRLANLWWKNNDPIRNFYDHWNF